MRAIWAAYSYGVEREWISRPVGRLLWGTDVRPLYSAIASLGDLPEGTSVLDVPCGGGLALRGVRPGVRYVAADLSMDMLARTRRRRPGVPAVLADIVRLPFADGEFDVCVTFNGLHCVPDPAGALRELARCLKPGGTLVGDTIVRGARRDRAIGAFRRAGLFGNPGTADDLARWLGEAGFRVGRLIRSGAVVHFTATCG